MPVTSYPFIDIAVHERVRAHFAQGDAVCLFAPDLSSVLWSNGEGAALFGEAFIYDFLDAGPATGDVAFRQLQAAARALTSVGEIRRFTMRIPQGFRSLTVGASVERIALRPGEQAVLFATPRPGGPLSPSQAAARMISGFDDPDTHMAVLDGEGAIVAASSGFSALAMQPRTLAHLVAAVGRDSDWLLKRPVPTGRGTLPAAIGKLSETPALHLLFAVETILGHLDASPDFDDAPPASPPVRGDAPAAEAPTPAPVAAPTSTEVAPPLLDDAHDLSAEEQAPFEWEAPAEDEAEDEAAVEIPSEARIDPDHGADTAADVSPDASHTADREAADAPEQTDQSEPAPSLPETMAEETRANTEDMPADDVAAEEQSEEPAIEAVPKGTAPSSEPLQDETAGLPAPPFVFDRAMRAVRFVWKIGADGRFSEISPDFALAVGPRAADVIGQTFEELASRLGLDPDETISTLLRRRDTWSGKTVLWPVEGEALRVPVDLAALPTYSRNRDFDGFRGFGIVRMSDVVTTQTVVIDDAPPAADATAAAPQATMDQEEAAAETPSTLQVEAAAEAPVVQDVPTAGDLRDTPAPAAGPDGDEDDPFHGERPALKLVETPNRRSTDKIVSIEAHRAGTPETLSRAEQAAFREIARQLGTTFGKRTTPPAEPDVPEAPASPSLPEADMSPLQTAAAGEEAQSPLATEAGQSPHEAPDAAEQAAEQMAGVVPGDPQPDAPAAETTPQSDDRPDAVEFDEGSSPPAEAELATLDDAPGDTLHDEMANDADPNPAAESDDASTDEDDQRGGTEAEAEPAVGGEREAAVETAREEASLNVATLNRMPMAMLVHSGDELYHANPEFLKLTGYATLEELRVEGGLDALFVGDDEGMLDTPDGAVMMIRNDGRLLPVYARLQSIRFEDRGAALMMSLATVAPEPPAPAPPPVTLSLVPPAPPPVATEVSDAEVSQTSDLQGALETAEARAAALGMEAEELRSILETATDGVVVIGADGEIRSLNRSASALFNYDDAEVRAKPFAMLFAHESQRAVMDYLAGLSGHGVASVLNDGREVIGREAGGGFIPLFMTMGRLSSSNGYCAVIRDITQWKRSEEELRAAKRAAETANAHKTEFLARVSHEIRTPLNAIIGFSDMMASEHFGPIGNARYVEYAGDIGRSGRHVLDIVNDLLDISKIEAGEMELDFAEVDINEAVSEAVALVQPQANMQRVIIRTSLPGTVPAVVADQRSIKQIALNILSNAIRFTPSGGQIVVSTAYEPNGSVILRIRDTGIGMTRSELDQAMKPFRQVTTGARKRGDGTGLGLPLTKAMTEANRATFSIHSAPNEGTLVEVAFPSQRVLAD